ncbi:glycosyltransferase [Bacillus sp. 1P10SD]|uniref:glycosyltransferase family protein n=1 Tax=Bacillus sp. 1P10SD TaxID=3132265 RepID=UPI0039A438D8
MEEIKSKQNQLNKFDNNTDLRINFKDYFLRIAVIGKGNHFVPYRDALVNAINCFGFEAQGFDHIEYDFNPDVFLIINPFQFDYNNFKYQNYIYAGIQTEQIVNNEVYCLEMGLKNYKKLQKYIKKYDLMFEWSPSSYRFLSKRYDNIYFFPHCNFNSMQYIDKYPTIEEKYDLFFIGWATGIHDRREKLLRLLTEHYNVFPKYEIWGSEKEKAMLSSKICLNLHFDNCLVYESPRMYEYIANKRFVLTEKISDSYPFVEGEDYDSFYIHNMIQKIDFYLSNSEERNRIANNGFNKINKYMIDDNINILIERLLLEKWIRKSKRQRIKNILFHKIGYLNKKF